MAIPEFINGMLPEGIWDCSLAEIEARFGGFDRTTTRRELFANLKAYFEEAQSVVLIRAVYVDGSFVTDKPEPGDVDIIVVFASEQNSSIDLRPFEYNAISKRMIRRRHKMDVLTAEEGSLDEKKSLDLFTKVRALPDVRKGLLRVTL